MTYNERVRAIAEKMGQCRLSDMAAHIREMHLRSACIAVEEMAICVGNLWRHRNPYGNDDFMLWAYLKDHGLVKNEKEVSNDL